MKDENAALRERIEHDEITNLQCSQNHAEDCREIGRLNAAVASLKEEVARFVRVVGEPGPRRVKLSHNHPPPHGRVEFWRGDACPICYGRD